MDVVFTNLSDLKINIVNREVNDKEVMVARLYEVGGKFSVAWSG
jgi:hypothetical protein